MASGVIQGNDGLAGGGGKPPSLKTERSGNHVSMQQRKNGRKDKDILENRRCRTWRDDEIFAVGRSIRG